MAPSRGLLRLLPVHIHVHIRFPISSQSQCAQRRFSSTARLARLSPNDLTSHIRNPTNVVQSYISTSHDPFLNLSIEHYLLQNTSEESKILFLYRNKECVVIGRNQNPWVEVNLPLLLSRSRQQGRQGQGKQLRDDDGDNDIGEGEGGREREGEGEGKVDLVRRRSGGGTVFHDLGNVNWSVICPPSGFTRDKHAEMVVKGLRKLGIQRARVNERHDIVLDTGENNTCSDAEKPFNEEDTHDTPYVNREDGTKDCVKVSGSAYKLTRTRALHHGTALCESPNLKTLGRWLKSPVRGIIKARGVESVSSPVGNIGVSGKDFEDCVQAEFANMYEMGIGNEEMMEAGEEWLNIEGVRKGYEELKTLDWLYAQTPSFTLYTQPPENSPPSTPSFIHPYDPELRHESLAIEFKHSKINSLGNGFENGGDPDPQLCHQVDILDDAKIHEYPQYVQEMERMNNHELGLWLTEILPTPR